jgi:hypothetical protein
MIGALAVLNLAMSILTRSSLALLSSLTCTLITTAQIRETECWEYLGKLGDKTEIGMTLYMQEGKLRGNYYYVKNLKDITLSAQDVSERDITLDERDSSGVLQGTFHLRFVESDPELKSDQPLTVDVLRGEWTRADGKVGLPVRLRLQYSCNVVGSHRYGYGAADANSDEFVEKNVQGFYFAVLRGDKGEAAKYVSFPLSFFLNKKSKTVYNRTAFLRYYDQIFAKAFLARIAEGVPHHLFTNWEGIMIGDGAVWFDENGKANHFNN